MGVWAVWEMNCDDCRAAYVAPYRATVSAQVLRRYAARDGWHATQRGKVYCPDHKPKTRAAREEHPVSTYTPTGR